MLPVYPDQKSGFQVTGLLVSWIQAEPLAGRQNGAAAPFNA